MDQRERHRYFDSYVASVDTALRHPEIAAQLGSLAGRLLAVNARAYLPNKQHGQMYTPLEYQGNPDAFALIPLTGREAYRTKKLLAPIANELGPRQYPPPVSQLPSSGFRMETLEVASQYRNFKYPVSKPRNFVYPLARNQAGAASTTTFTHIDQRGLCSYTPSRIRVLIHANNVPLDFDCWNQAASVAHEEVHVLDFASPQLYGTAIGTMSSEMVAYHVTHLLYNMTRQMTAGRDVANAVETWRLQNLGPGNFIPQLTHLPAFCDLGIIHPSRLRARK